MKFLKYITNFIAFVLIISPSLMNSMDKPLQEKALDYASRYKKQLGMGIGAAAALGGLYYAYRLGMSQSPQGQPSNIVNRGNWAFENREEREFQVGQKSLIKITNSAGDIEVKTHAGNTIKVQIHKKAETQAELDNIYTDFSEDAQRLTITTRQRVSTQVIKSLINYKLLVPQDKIFALTAYTQAGNIDVDGIKRDVNAQTFNGDVVIKNSNGDVVGDSKNGNLTVSRINGTLNATTSNGDIKIDTIGGNVTTRTNHGDIGVVNVNGLLNASTAAGNVTAEQVKNARIKSDLGNILVRANQGTFNGSTSAGNVTLDQDIIDQPININSNMGDIKVSARNINGSIKPKTSLGQVRSDFPMNQQGSTVVTLQTSMGNITVKQK